MSGITRYINSDLVLSSSKPLDVLCEVFDRDCCVLYQEQDDEGIWHVAVESCAGENKAAADDIQEMIEVMRGLSGVARQQWDDCSTREVNIGFETGETWAYPHRLPMHVVRAIADAECDLEITLYPVRNENDP